MRHCLTFSFLSASKEHQKNMANDAIFDDFWMSLRASLSFDAANPKGSKWMCCSESLLRNKQDQQNFLLWLSLIRLAQTGVTTKQMITNATIAGKFCSPPNSSITRLALTTWRAHVDEVTTWKFFLFLELKQKISSNSVNLEIKRHWDWGQRFGKFMKIPLDVNKLVSHQNHVLSANGV